MCRNRFRTVSFDRKCTAVLRCIFQSVKKQHSDSCTSCGSTHKIEFAEQIHKFREHGPDHPLLPLCGNSPCVSRNLYKGRKNVPARRDFSSKFDRKRGFDREAARKTLVFRQPQNAPQFCGAFFADTEKTLVFAFSVPYNRGVPREHFHISPVQDIRQHRTIKATALCGNFTL